jgi:hypothetical protein
MRGRLACTVGAVAALALLAACSSGGSGGGSTQPPKTVYVTASSTPPSTPASVSPSTTAAPRPVTKLTATCDSVMPLLDLQDALDVDIAGKTSFVVGLPDRGIGRLAYINCRYGLVGGAAAVPKVEIGVSLYNSAAQAAKRLDGTIDDYVGHGATQTPITVSGHEGTILTGSSANGYDVPLLVVASGQRTIAVSVISRLVPTSARSERLGKIGGLVVDRSGG